MSVIFSVMTFGISDSSFWINHMAFVNLFYCSQRWWYHAFSSFLLQYFLPYPHFQVMTSFPSSWEHKQAEGFPMLPPSHLPHAWPPCCNHVFCYASCLCGHAQSFHCGTVSHLPTFFELRTSLWTFSPASSLSFFHWIVSVDIITIIVSIFILLTVLLYTAVH